ncbi:DUF2182 domain-containing protein [Novosphingobium sp. TW-4]|uniref:DUF2182 domain-containing protein n=2 Tax=Novosphingobium olei TaxID=2728851 RepID=A0A7Y0BSP1_9SPHN|nr:DUF2182 domain-containing protein [Novosphingobium olei]
MGSLLIFISTATVLSGRDPVRWRRALAHPARVSAVLLALLCIMAWAWVLSGAGTGMAISGGLWPRGATSSAMGATTMSGGPLRFVILFAMWWVMMAAMMLPAASPTILLFDRVATQAPGRGKSEWTAAGLFLAGYLLLWGAFSLAIAALQSLLAQSGMMEPMTMALTSSWLAGLLLFCAGIYQLTPAKNACLRQCRNPAVFLSRYYRPGRMGALRMGLIHGAICVGCCWLLMALLFVGGVMNVVWIALLSVLVAFERVSRFGNRIAAFVGICMIGLSVLVWGGAISS